MGWQVMKLVSVAFGFGDQPIVPILKELGIDYAATEWERRSVDDARCWDHDSPVDPRWWGTYVVRASSLAEARGFLPLFRSEGKASRFVLFIEGLSPKQAGGVWTRRRLASRARALSFDVPGLGFATIIEGGTWVEVHMAAAAALSSADGGHSSPVLGGLRVGILDPHHLDWTAGDSLASLMTAELLRPTDDDIFCVDVILGDSLAPLPKVDGRVTPQLWSPGLYDLPPVDIAVINPRGFLPYTDGHSLTLSRNDVAERGALSSPELLSLRSADYVSVDGSHFSGEDYLLARRLAQLAVAGVPMLPSNLSNTVGKMLGSRIMHLMSRFDHSDHPIQRESKSINLRRAAFEQFAPIESWNRVLKDLGRPPVADPLVSVLIATRRSSKVSSVLTQIAQQTWSRLEVVLVLHGIAAEDSSVRQAVADFVGQITVISVSADVIFGDVLNAGTKAAGGEYLTKMDDDDWYGPNHIRDLVRSMQYSGAVLVGAQVEFVYLASLDITTRRPPLGEQYSDHVAGGTMLLRLDDLRWLGGWRPVHRAVDRCLLQAVGCADGLIYRTHGQNYLMHRHSSADLHGGHTWNPDDTTFVQSVAEQWDGFSPPPQIQMPEGKFHGLRLQSMKSQFAE